MLITASVVIGATLAVVAGYPGKYFNRPPEEVPVSASQAMLDLQKHNYSTGKIFAEGRIELFDKTNASQPVESMQFKYAASGNKYYQMTGPVEMINGNQYSLYVHHEKQLVQVAHAEQMPGRQLFSQAAIIDSLLHNNKMDAKVKKADNGLLMLIINQPGDEQASAYRILYDPKDFSIKKIEMDLPPGEDAGTEQLVVVTYDKLLQSIEDKDALFSEKRFIKKLRKTFALADEFSGYQLINLIPDK